MLTYALFRIRAYVKMLQTKRVFPNEIIIITFLISEYIILSAHISSLVVQESFKNKETQSDIMEH